MPRSSYKWEIFPDSVAVPPPIFKFLHQTNHGSLFQLPEWTNCISDKPIKNLTLCVSKNGNPIFGALVQKSYIPGTRFYIGTIRRGPVFEDIDTAIELWGEFEKMICRKGLIALIVYPYWERPAALKLESYLESCGYAHAPMVSDHSDSLVIDLTYSMETVFQNFSKSQRRNLRRMQRKGITSRHITSSAEMDLFYQMHLAMCTKKGISGLSLADLQRVWLFAKSNPDYCACINTWYANEVIGGDIILRHGNRAVVTYITGSPNPLKGIDKTCHGIWSAIQWAKQAGARVFDMGGFAPDTKKGSWLWDVNQYKLRFSKKKVAFFRPKQKIFLPALFHLHRILRQTKKALKESWPRTSRHG